MSKRVGKDVEILVHIAAPSAGKDDTHYRALAAAYLEFEVTNTVKLETEVGDGFFSASDEEAESQLLAELMQAEDLGSREGVDHIIDKDDDSSKVSQSEPQSVPERRYLTRSTVKKSTPTVSPQVSFNSVLDNADSPPLPRHPQSAPETTPLTAGNPLKSLSPALEALWNTPPSVVEDSQPSYDRAICGLSSPTVVLEQYLQLFEAPKTPPIPSIEIRGDDPQEEPIGEFIRTTPSHLEASFIVQTPDTTPEVINEPIALFSSPVEQSQKRFILETRKQKPATTPEGVSKSTARLAFRSTRRSKSKQAQLSLRSTLDRDTSQSPPRKRRAVSDQTKYPQLVSELPSSNVLRSSSQNHIHVPNDRLTLDSSSYTTSVYSNKQKDLEFSSSISSKVTRSQKSASRLLIDRNPNEIHPPPPPTSTTKYPDHQLLNVITPSLDNFFTDLHSSYKPQMQLRPLRALERGYWSVSMKDWESKLRTKAWDALGRFIREGKGGWGVWCVRCEDRDAGGDGHENEDGKVVGKEVGESDKKRATRNMNRMQEEIQEGKGKEGTVSGENIQPNLTHLRLYCWAETTAHCWLLLYLVSQKNIKTSETKWIDGSGKAVIFMN